MIARWTIPRKCTASFSKRVARRYHRTNPVRAQPVPNALRMIGFIATNAPRARAWPSFRSLHLYAADQGFELGRLVRPSWQQQRAQGYASSIKTQVHLGAEAAA